MFTISYDLFGVGYFVIMLPLFFFCEKAARTTLNNKHLENKKHCNQCKILTCCKRCKVLTCRVTSITRPQGDSIGSKT